MTIGFSLRRAGVVAALAVGVAAAPAVAQDEAALKSFFEGRYVTAKIDLPGTSDGVDLHVDSRQPMDFSQYGNRIKANGVAVRAGDSVIVTQVKVKKDLIEFHLAGGGYGTFGDDTSTTVYLPHVEKSEREKELEKKIDHENDRDRRRDMTHELDELRERREREDRRIDAEAAEQSARKAELVMQRRLHGGSRFNLRYDDAVPRGITPQEVMAALGEYLSFDGMPGAARGTVMEPASLPTPPLTAPPSGPIELRKGMAREEVETMLGRASSSADRHEGNETITVLAFSRGDQRITAEFVEGILIRYTIASR